MKRWAADTNIVVRLLVQDDARQSQAVVDALAENTLVVQATVLLETEWVLRGVLGYRRSDVTQAFDDLLALPNIELSEEKRVLEATAMHGQGMGFADALHFAGAIDCDAFLTFDPSFARRASRGSSVPPVRLLR